LISWDFLLHWVGRLLFPLRELPARRRGQCRRFALPAANELLFATGFRWLSCLQLRMVNNQWLVKNFAIGTMNDLSLGSLTAVLLTNDQWFGFLTAVVLMNDQWLDNMSTNRMINDWWLGSLTTVFLTNYH